MGSDCVIPDLIQQMGRQILSAHPALDQIVLVGILSSGYPLAQRLAFFLEKETGTPVQVGKLDVALYR
ncbi:MAG: bifunctional pyr operon transcriptional regulator/uracil phosphoribosyltransferase, partial [Candidatus Margulisbacteria bacterium]|nr:bifunctional pyr operon transcriptional regulator/uracil phosphoribosyltransferase [Candidatus Margulisiibacteriota bacterium]